MYHLIIPSNLNFDSFENTLFAYYDKYKKFESLLILETKETLDYDINIRNSILKKIFGKEIEIREKDISNNTNILITHVINKSLKEYSREKIIVDLTNATKEISSLLYMAASLSRIKNINYITVLKENNNRFYQLKKLDKQNISQYYNIKNFEPLQEINSLAKWNFFDLLFYKDKIEKVFSNYPKKMQEITENWKIQFENAIDHYFKGEKDYGSALRTIGVLMEDVKTKVLEIIKKDEKYKMKNLNDVFNDFFGEIREKHKKKEMFNDFRDKNFSTDKFFEILRLYRNESSHSFEIKFKEEDIQTMILILITLFINIREFFIDE